MKAGKVDYQHEEYSILGQHRTNSDIAIQVDIGHLWSGSTMTSQGIIFPNHRHMK